jgi:MEMO1 family protein
MPVALLSRPCSSKRVFILGPSHHVYLDGCALSKCTEYETPLGNLPLDLDSKLDVLFGFAVKVTRHAAIKELRASGKFSDMSTQTDEDEHSIEMHLPYIRKIFEGYDIPYTQGNSTNSLDALAGLIYLLSRSW